MSTDHQQDPRRQFDFWLGEWDVSWDEDGAQRTGTNRVELILDGKVILENFDGRPAMDFQGKSVSVYDQTIGRWRQTWVDSAGTYLDFLGDFVDGRMLLQREGVFEGQSVLQRMVWYDITPENLQWNWERSRDSGATWELTWHIDYRRRILDRRS